MLTMLLGLLLKVAASAEHRDQVIEVFRCKLLRSILVQARLVISFDFLKFTCLLDRIVVLGNDS